MTDTQTLVLSLAKSLSDSAQSYTLYFDNLFFNIFLAVKLEKLDIKVISTARVSTKELSSSLIELKHAKKILN